MIEQAVILAAGRSTRLGQLTKDRPKSMLPVLGKPILVRVMDRLREAGIRKFVVVLSEHEGAVASYLSRSWYSGVEVKFALQAIPSGSLDALMLAAPHIRGPFLLTSVDNLTSSQHIQNLMDNFNRSEDLIASLSLIPATPEIISQSYAVSIENDRITALVEKPATPSGSHAAFMIYALSPDFLKEMSSVSSRGEREINTAVQNCLRDGRQVGYAIAEWRMHLAQETDLLAINRRYLQEGRDTHILSEIPASVHIIPPVRIDPKVSVGQSARIGPNVYLETGATVGQGAVLSDAVVLDGAIVPAHDQCQGQIVDRHYRISETEKL